MRIRTIACAVTACVGVLASFPAIGGEVESRVTILDSGPHTSIAKPGAPKHIVGLPRLMHDIVLDTGTRRYGLRYVVALDEEHPTAAIPGEGYIGMHQPSGCNWYGGGFFDLQINGQSVGTRRVSRFAGRSTRDRGWVDYLFDTDTALARVRFVALAARDVLFCQVALEPKADLESLRLVLRCYPSAFVTNGERHVQSKERDAAQGDAFDVNLETENWLLFSDRIFDEGYVSPTRTGVGPCSVVWIPGQTDAARVTVGSYAVDTTLELKTASPDHRFIFIDHAGTRNADALTRLRAQASDLLSDLRAIDFTSPTVSVWSMAAEQQRIDALLKALDARPEMVDAYNRRSEQLTLLVPKVRAGGPGAIQAEDEAGKLIADWTEGIPALKLQALLDGI